MNIEQLNQEKIEDQAVNHLLQIGFFKIKICVKKECDGAKCNIKRRKRS